MHGVAIDTSAAFTEKAAAWFTAQALQVEMNTALQKEYAASIKN